MPVEGLAIRFAPGQRTGSPQPPKEQDEQSVEREVLRSISELSNHIAQKEAHARLMAFKKSHPEVFTSVKLLVAAHEYLGRYTFQLPVRQFVLNMFHSRIDFFSKDVWTDIDNEPLR